MSDTIDSSKVTINSTFPMEAAQTPSTEHCIFAFKVGTDGKPIKGSQGWYKISDLLTALGQDAEDAKDEAVAAKEFIQGVISSIGYVLPTPKAEFIPNSRGDGGKIRLKESYDQLGNVTVKVSSDSGDDDYNPTLTLLSPVDAPWNGNYFISATQADEDYPLGSSQTAMLTVGSLKCQKPRFIYSGAVAKEYQMPEAGDTQTGVFVMTLFPSAYSSPSGRIFQCQYMNGVYAFLSDTGITAKVQHVHVTPNYFALGLPEDKLYVQLIAAAHGSDEGIILFSDGFQQDLDTDDFFGTVTIPDILLENDSIDYVVMFSSVSSFPGDLYERVLIPADAHRYEVAVGSSVKVQPASGETVELVCPTKDYDQINYAVDEAFSFSDASQYSGRISVTSPAVIRAAAIKAFLAMSDISTFSAEELLADVVLSRADGDTSDTCTVEVASSPEGAAVYYTTDGSIPDEDSDELTAAITIAQNCIVKARAFAADGKASKVTSLIVGDLQVQAPVITIADPEEEEGEDA